MKPAADPDVRWMDLALREAARGVGRTSPNPPVGAVVVGRGGRRHWTGYHHRAGRPHAEVEALRAAGAGARGGTLYVTLEPCSTHGRTPPCTDAVLAAGVRRVVAAIPDPNPIHAGRGLRILRRAGVRVRVGVRRDEAAALIAPFATWVRSGMPFLTLKLALSADGRIADGRGRSRWLTGPASRRLVHRWRAECDAVLVGAGTVRADNPGLLPSAAAARPPLRVVVCSGGRLPSRARVLSDRHAGRTIVAVTARCGAAARRRLERGGARVWVLPAAGGGVSLDALLRRLGREGVLHVLCEGGGRLAGDLLRRGLADRLALFYAPLALGADGVPAFSGNWPLGRAPRLCFESVARVGEDLLAMAAPRRSQGRGASCSPG
jgi:diaminohydroxyphosphoribosylaminopyrimidine deaminase/5-amino-6-(5-phosphoribosylamino)uracil reductase